MYNYLEEMKNDIATYLEENLEYKYLGQVEDLEELEEKLNEDLWTEDSVTGNASGSYTFDRWEAQEYVSENLDLLKEACEEFETDAATVGNWFLSEEWETMDVTIRCYLLAFAISEVLEENADEFEKAISEALEEI